MKTPLTDAVDKGPKDKAYDAMRDHARRMERERAQLIEYVRLRAQGLGPRSAAAALLRELGEEGS